MRRRLLYILLAAVVAAALVLGYFYLQAPPATPVRQGQPAPDVVLVAAEGRLRLSSLRHVPVSWRSRASIASTGPWVSPSSASLSTPTRRRSRASCRAPGSASRSSAIPEAA